MCENNWVKFQADEVFGDKWLSLNIMWKMQCNGNINENKFNLNIIR